VCIDISTLSDNPSCVCPALHGLGQQPGNTTLLSLRGVWHLFQSWHNHKIRLPQTIHLQAGRDKSRVVSVKTEVFYKYHPFSYHWRRKLSRFGKGENVIAKLLPAAKPVYILKTIFIPAPTHTLKKVYMPLMHYNIMAIYLWSTELVTRDIILHDLQNRHTYF